MTPLMVATSAEGWRQIATSVAPFQLVDMRGR
jgi:hypothetical protein